MPYNILLQKNTREALEINIKDQIVIIDEAHNIVDAIRDIYTVSVELLQIHTAYNQLGAYLTKYKNRLSPKNQNRIRILLLVLKAIYTNLLHWSKKGSQQAIVSVNEWLHEMEIADVNLWKLQHFIKESKIAKKVNNVITNAS